MADAADLKSASHKEYGFDPRPGYQLSFYGKRKLDKEKRCGAFFEKKLSKKAVDFLKKVGQRKTMWRFF